MLCLHFIYIQFNPKNLISGFNFIMCLTRIIYEMSSYH